MRRLCVCLLGAVLVAAVSGDPARKRYRYRDYSSSRAAPSYRESYYSHDEYDYEPYALASDSYGYGYEDTSDDGGGLSPLLALAAPIAGIVLLGAAALVATNPLLLQIAVLNNGRKKRSANEGSDYSDLTPEIQQKLHEMQVLEKFMAKVPGESNQEEKIMATYLSCSGYTDSQNMCLDRLVCEFSSTKTKMSQLEKDVISIILYNIMANNYVVREFKDRLRSAALYGREKSMCHVYKCAMLQ